MNTPYKINKNVIMDRAVNECYTELFAKAQPSADWNDIKKAIKDKTIEDHFYRHYYLSKEEFDYIIDKYIDAYRFTNKWNNYTDIVKKYLTDGGLKDKYIPETTDADGFTHPGYRSSEEVDSIKKQIRDIMYNFDSSDAAQEVADNIYDAVMKTVSYCQEFYKFERDESSFRFSVCLGCSPTDNKEEVEKYWAEQGKPIQIEERIPCLFWYYDKGYTEEELEEEFEVYGPDWKQKLYDEWKEEKKMKEKESKERYEQLLESLKDKDVQEENKENKENN